MKYLLDTHILIWFISGDEQLSLYAKELIENEDNELLVSIASLWEMAIKFNLGKEVREFAEKINQLSLEDKQWLLQQLMQQVTISNNSDLNSSNSLTNEVKKTFNITPAVPGSGYTDTAINHDQILANTLLGES